MKRKLSLVILVLASAVLVLGCNGGGTAPVVSDETQITNKIEQFCTALSNQHWSLAESYCYPESSAYLTVEQYRELIESYPPGTTFEIDPAIQSITIIENQATVELNPVVQVCYQGNCVTESMDHPGTTTLIKSEGEWYLYY